MSYNATLFITTFAIVFAAVYASLHGLLVGDRFQLEHPEFFRNHLRFKLLMAEDDSDFSGEFGLLISFAVGHLFFSFRRRR